MSSHSLAIAKNAIQIHDFDLPIRTRLFELTAERLKLVADTIRS